MAKIVLQPDAAAGQDCFIDSDYPDDNYGISTPLILGGAFISLRPLIKFDLSTVPEHFTSATLSLYYESQGTGGTESTVKVYRIKRAWTEGTQDGSDNNDGATWNEYNGSNAWQTAGATGVNDYDSSEIGTATVPGAATNDFIDIALTPTNKTDLDLGNGWMLMLTDETTLTIIGLTASDGVAAQRPKLTFTLLGGVKALPNQGLLGHLLF